MQEFGRSNFNPLTFLGNNRCASLHFTKSITLKRQMNCLSQNITMGKIKEGGE